MTIVWGILCLGLIVFVHELGHFIAARICGVKVESFSIGMGPVLVHKTIGETDYRLSLLPFGGYCGMKGEQAFRDALEQNLPSIPKEEGGFYGVHPLKRAIIAFSGPAMNLIFAIISFSIIAMTGYTFYAADNKVILADDVYPEMNSAAKAAGIQTGDKILFIDGKEITDFSQISQTVSIHPNEQLEVIIERDGVQQKLFITPSMDSSTGQGKIGVMNWVSPQVYAITVGAAAYRAGLQEGDVITAINGQPVNNTVDIQKLLPQEASTVALIQVMREGNINPIELSLTVPANGDLGLMFSVPAREAPRYSFFPAIWQGTKETGELFALTFKSIGLLFKGVDVTQAVSGPVRITVMLGDTVQTGFKAGFRAGLTSTLNFLALISISLFIMNLLPIPILDGGLILFALIETIIRRPVHPKVMYYTQFIGIAFIVILFGIALFSDARYLFSDFFRR